ncbi:hypothetical protein ACMBCN_02920 [Candidatus Liberibacter asiaticus]
MLGIIFFFFFFISHHLLFEISFIAKLQFFFFSFGSIVVRKVQKSLL